MSGETEANVSGWTTDTLHSHLIRQIDGLRDVFRTHVETELRAVDLASAAQKAAMDAALAAADRAVVAALAAQKEAASVLAITAEKRADTQNEWRASLNDILQRAMPRAEAEAIVARITERIQELATTVVTLITRAEFDALSIRLSERISDLSDRVTAIENATRGAARARAGLYAALGAATMLITIVVIVVNLVTAHK